MKITQHALGEKTQHFDSLNELYTFTKETPTNSVFKMARRLDSMDTSAMYKKFTGTDSFEQAVELLKNGWNEGSQTIEGKLQAKIKCLDSKKSQRPSYDVVGGNCSVPRYLQGVPTSMINRKPVVKKQKVITINKYITYSAYVTAEQIIDESVKAFLIIREIEAAGTRVNLNIIDGLEEGGERAILTVRIKNAGERLNISKMAFPLAHPSMLRRLAFKWLEVTSIITNPGFTMGYGMPMSVNDLKKYMGKGEILLPNFIPNIDDVIKQFV